MSNWSTSNYRQRKAARLAARPARWETNPETQERFFIRPVGGFGLMLSGYLSSALKEEALEGWKEHGIEPEASNTDTSEGVSVIKMTAREVDRTNQNLAKVIYQSCLVPTLVAGGENPKDVHARALANCAIAFADEESWKSANKEEKAAQASQVVMDLADLDENDALFIFKCASQLSAGIPMKGGAVMDMAAAKSLRKTPGRRARTGTGG